MQNAKYKTQNGRIDLIFNSGAIFAAGRFWAKVFCK
jgi:hypothetical protein